jgi:hypothetical protein
MSFSVKDGLFPIAQIKSGKYNREILYITDNPKSKDLGPQVDESVKPLMNTDTSEKRVVEYIAGPSGVGKTTIAIELIKNYLRLFPKTPFYLFSRTPWQEDPAYKSLKRPPIQINLGEEDIDQDITSQFPHGSLIFFDDVTTIADKNIKKKIEHLICDILEVGRKARLNIIITNHLIVPIDQAFARTILNELQMLTIFPKSGAVQQITHVLKTYFGFSPIQIKRILTLPSRWVRISRTYPQYVLYDKGAYIP